jgi:hypothetical protein
MRLSDVAGRGVMLVLLAGACAPPAGAPPTPARQPETISIESPTSSASVILRRDPSESSVSFALPASRVWAAVPSAYNALPIPIQAIDSLRRYIQGAAPAYRQFLRTPVSRFVDCGTTLVGPSADTYHLQIAIETRVDSLGPSTSSLSTHITATGSGSGGTARCATTGSLEKLVETQVEELLGLR